MSKFFQRCQGIVEGLERRYLTLDEVVACIENIRKALPPVKSSRAVPESEKRIPARQGMTWDQQLSAEVRSAFQNAPVDFKFRDDLMKSNADFVAALDQQGLWMSVS